MYHGSNTMWKSYFTDKGKLSGGKRTDGQVLKPGTAVFVLKEGGNRSHVGLYIGNGKVIEAAGQSSGVIYSDVSNKKWAEWGELKGVEYDAAPVPTPVPAPEPTPSSVKTATVIGKRLALRQAPSTSANIIMRVDTGEKVELLDDTEWVRVKYQGKTGYMMTKFLQF